MCNFVRKVFAVLLLCFMQSLHLAEGLYITPGYIHFDRNKRGPTTVCAQIKPTGAENHEPYYMCKGPEFPSWQPNVQTQIVQPTALHPPMGENLNLDLPQILQFGNAYQQMPQLPQMLTLRGESPLPQEMAHYFPVPANLGHQSDISTGNPTNFDSYAPNNYDNFRSLDKTDILPVPVTNQKHESTNTHNPKKIQADSRKHDINPEQFKALLEDEVLGAPNLAFSHDELLQFQHMYSEPKSEIPLPLELPYLQPANYDDPILRSFYNIDHGNIVKPYLPILQDPSLPVANIDEYSNGPLHAINNGRYPSTEPTGKCCDCPLTFQPILIAVPWPRSPYHDRLSNIPPISCGKDTAFNSCYLAQTRSYDESHSAEELPKKISMAGPEVSVASSQPQTNSTESSESSEEDLFVADTATKNYDQKSQEDTQDEKKAEIKVSTTTDRHTTFKTIIHSARMWAQSANTKRDPTPQPQNKRHIQYVGNTVYPRNFKREYVRKLSTNVY